MAATRRRGNRRWQNVLLLLASVALTLVALELLISIRLPFAHTSTPRRMGPAGKTFEPHAEVRWTNYLDYAETQQANSLGFLDREPPAKKDPGVFRIVALGDSFVEAMQVPIAKKFHVGLEEELTRQYPGRRFEAVAFGQSSATTASELAFYETFGRALEPDLVIVVFVHNDFADNSPLLGSLAYGWHPDHPPWPLIAADPSGTGFRRLAADRDFLRYSLGIEAPPDSSATLKESLGWSRLVQFGVAAWTQGFGWTARRQYDVESLRLAHLRSEERFRQKNPAAEYIAIAGALPASTASTSRSATACPANHCAVPDNFHAPAATSRFRSHAHVDQFQIPLRRVFVKQQTTHIVAFDGHNKPPRGVVDAHCLVTVHHLADGAHPLQRRAIVRAQISILDHSRQPGHVR